MTADDIIKKFKTDYPGKNIVALPEDSPTEIICEVDPTSEHPEVNVAIAAIKASTPHYHHKATEVYEVLQGELELTVDGTQTTLYEGDTHTIQPGQVHSATGNFTLVRVTSRPGWTIEDHILFGV